MTVRDEARPEPAAFLLWAAGGLFSVLAFGLVFVVGEQSFPWLGVLAHLVGTACVGAGTMLAKGLDHPAARAWAILVMFFAFFGGPLGYLAGVACYLFGVGQPTELPLVDVVKAEMWIRPMALPVSEALPSFETSLREEVLTQPIVDLVPASDIPTAVAIVNYLSQRRTPEDVSWLRKLSQDRRPEVYQYSLSKLDELEKDYARRIYQLHESTRAHPHDPVLRLELAKLYLEYTRSGLLDGPLQDYYWELTLAQVFEAMLHAPERSELWVDLAYILHARGLSREAELVLGDALNREPGNLRGQLLFLECLMTRAQREESPELFAQARKRALETAWAVRLPAKKEGNPLFDLGQFWFGRHKGGAAGRG